MKVKTGQCYLYCFKIELIQLYITQLIIAWNGAYSIPGFIKLSGFKKTYPLQLIVCEYRIVMILPYIEGFCKVIQQLKCSATVTHSSVILSFLITIIGGNYLKLKSIIKIMVVQDKYSSSDYRTRTSGKKTEVLPSYHQGGGWMR